MATCDYCHGTGTRYDPTCAGNVNTDAQTVSPCRACNATGAKQPPVPRKPWTPPFYVECDPDAEIPEWMR